MIRRNEDLKWKMNSFLANVWEEHLQSLPHLEYGHIMAHMVGVIVILVRNFA